MKLRNFEEWKKQFMIDSDPKTGNKVGMRMDDITMKKLSDIEDIFFEIDDKYMKYNIIITETAISYQGVSISKNAYVMVFDSIDEIKNQKNNSLLDIFNLHITIEINDDTKYHIKKIQERPLFKKQDNLDYDGIDLRKKNVPEIYTLDFDKFKKPKKEASKDFNPIDAINQSIEKYCSFTLEEPINLVIATNAIPFGLGVTTSFLCMDTYEEMQQIIYCLKRIGTGYIHIRNEKEFKDEYFEKRTWLIIDNAEKFPLAFFKKIDKWFDEKLDSSQVNKTTCKMLDIPNIKLIFKIKTKPQLIDAMSKCKRSTIPIILKPSMIHWKDKKMS